MENIENLFRDEVREKKKIASNIFSRRSTRKGGSNQALKTPYLYMSNKERKKLNGEVMVYKMNNLMSYNEFAQQDESVQKSLMEHWRDNFKTADIKKALGVSPNKFYKIIDQLGLEKETSRVRVATAILTEEELEKYRHEFIDYPTFRELGLEQQGYLLEAYLDDYKTMVAVSKKWEGSQSGYLYSVISRYNKRKKKLEGSSVVDSEVSSVILEVNDTPKEPISQEEMVSEAIELLDSVGYFDKYNQESEMIHEDSIRGNDSNIDIKTNSFSFSLNGTFDSETIKRRLQMVLEVLENEDEFLDLEIKITNTNV